MDITTDLANVAETPVNAVVRGRWHPYFGEIPFLNPYVKQWPSISRIDSTEGKRTVHFENGTSLDNVDHIIFGTGYDWTLPFLPDVPTRNNRVPGLYLHVFKRGDPTLAFVGAVSFACVKVPYILRTRANYKRAQVAAGLTFKVYEWQAVLAARVLAGRATLPSIEEQEKWEADRVAEKGDGVPFTALYPHFESYFEMVRKLAGEPSETRPGRKLPKWDQGWWDIFMAGHRRRVEMWRKGNEAAKKEIEGRAQVSAKL